MPQPSTESLLSQLDSLQDYVLDELDLRLDTRINELIKQLVASPTLQVSPATIDAGAAARKPAA